MHEPSVIEINLAAIGRNLQLLRQIVGPAVKICPMVKADAYGLGAQRIARTLVAAGADMLAVYTPGQAIELFEAGIGGAVLVLMPVREVERDEEVSRAFICGRLHLTVHDEDQLSDLIRIAERFGAVIPVHLEVDTGMSRGGCAVVDAPGLLARVASHPRLKLAGLFTHFASAEHDVAFTNEQHTRFERLIEEHEDVILRDCVIHAANSYATMRAHRFHRSMVRIGLAWAGYGLEEMSGDEVIEECEELEPAITWASRLIQIKRIAAGTPVGYGSRWRAPGPGDSVIGLVPVGYADGYPIGAGATSPSIEGGAPGSWGVGEVSANGHGSTHPPAPSLKGRGSVRLMLGTTVAHAPLVGAVNMDQITIDLTGVAASHDLRVGARVELISPDRDAPNHLPRLAERCGTFAHEMLCRLNPRLQRVYKTISEAEKREVAAVA